MTHAQQLSSLAPFTPVPVRRRRDGWTRERQRDFIRHLMLTGVVKDAARATGMSEASAYRLRKHADAASFAHAWDVALDLHAQYRMFRRRQEKRKVQAKRAPSLMRRITNADKANTAYHNDMKRYI